MGLFGFSLLVVSVIFNWAWVGLLGGLMLGAYYVFPPIDRYLPATILHDFLLEKQDIDRALADNLFYHELVRLDIPKWRATIMYIAVKIWGKIKGS